MDWVKLETARDKAFRRYMIPTYFVVFGVIAGGVFYDFTHIGYDPLTSSGPQSFFLYRQMDGNYTVFDGTQNAPFNNNIPFQIAPGSCEEVRFLITVGIGRNIFANMTQVDPIHCQAVPQH